MIGSCAMSVYFDIFCIVNFKSLFARQGVIATDLKLSVDSA